MSKISSNIKKNKVLLLLAGILIICAGLIIYGLFKYFYTGYSKSKYGDRLDDIHELHENYKSEIELIYKDRDVVKTVSVDTKGKIIYIILDLKKSITIEEAKSVALKSLDKFTTEEKSNYDIQFIITAKEIETDLFPIMGYKNKNNTKVVW